MKILRKRDGLSAHPSTTAQGGGGRRDGFSLVELLTVIAIIAILAAIIFPVMASVKSRAKMTQCITNLHNVSIALEQYRLDNRKYPETLGGYVKTDAGGGIIQMERTNDDESLYPEYIKTVKGFHCPLSSTTKTDAVVQMSAGGQTFYYYAYDNYDVFFPGVVNSGSPVTVGVAALRYAREWAGEKTAVEALPPYPPGTPASTSQSEYDYKRQLKWKSPPKDTVVTWCSFHRGGSAKAKIPVLFLDGHCDQVTSGNIEGADGASGSRWRTAPNL